jgi:hypothetical protein
MNSSMPVDARLFIPQVSNDAFDAWNTAELAVNRHQLDTQRLGQRHVRSIVWPHVVTQLPDPREQWDMVVPLQRHHAKQIQRTLALVGRQLAADHQTTKCRRTFQVNSMGSGKLLTRGGSADFLGDRIATDEKLDQR